MAHFAIIGENNIVQQTIVVKNEVAPTEEIGIAFVRNLYNDQGLNVRQTSYNTRHGIHYGSNNEPDGGIAFRGNYGSTGDTYDPVNDVFYRPRPVDMNNVICNSWTISAPTWEWKSPIPIPTDGNFYEWNEVTQSWVQVDITS
jgi:hypothetical protein